MTKNTRQREAVYAALCASHTHPTAAEVHDEVRKVIPNIGVATVYRTLAMLCDNGSAISLQDDNGVVHYDGCVTPHNHIYCSKCRRVLDIDIPVEADITADGRYKVERYSTMFYGACRNCV